MGNGALPHGPSYRAHPRLYPGFDMTGFTGGAYAGCDYQFGVWVLGIEGDWSKTNKEGQSFLPFNQVLVPLGLIAGANNWFTTQERWYATARARLGYAVDKW